MHSNDPRVQKVAAFFDRMASRVDLERLDEVYAHHAWFKDPYNEVQGLEAIVGIYRHMFDQLDQPRFVVLESICEGDAAFLVWNFKFLRKGTDQAISVIGTTQIRFNPQGRVAYHRDFWDPAEGIYEKLPWIGGFFRFIRRKAAGP